MWRYFVLSYDQLKLLTSNERAWSSFPPLLIIPYIYLLFSSENLTVNTMSPNSSSLSFLLPVCLRISSNYTLRVAKALTVYQKEEVRLQSAFKCRSCWYRNTSGTAELGAGAREAFKDTFYLVLVWVLTSPRYMIK